MFLHLNTEIRNCYLFIIHLERRAYQRQQEAGREDFHFHNFHVCHYMLKMLEM